MKLVNVRVIKDELERLIRNYRFYSSTEAKYRYEAYKELSEWFDELNISDVDAVEKFNSVQDAPFEQKPIDETPYPETLEKAIDLYYYSYGNGKGEFEHLSLEKFRDIVHTFVSDYGQKPAWSEEDEKMLKSIMATCELAEQERDSTPAKHLLEMQLNWLKSIKQRIGGISMKAYTNLEQSKKLAEILPLESADMFWLVLGNTPRVHVLTEPLSNYSQWESYPCWSLAALLSILPCNLKIALAINDDCQSNTVKHKYAIGSVEHDKYDCFADNPVDACYEMILKLKERNLI